MTDLGIAVECIECGQPVCPHQQAVIRRFEAEKERAEARVAELEAERDAILANEAAALKRWERAEAERDEARARHDMLCACLDPTLPLPTAALSPFTLRCRVEDLLASEAECAALRERLATRTCTSCGEELPQECDRCIEAVTEHG